MSTAVEQEGLVKESLFRFLKQHIPNAQLSCLDEFVLSYVVSIVEEVAATGGAEAVEGAFDAEAFIEVLSACFPAFANCVQSCHVTQWMSDLQEILMRQPSSVEGNDEETTTNCDGLSFKISEIHIPRPSSVSMLPHGASTMGRIKKLSETSEGSSDSGDYLSGQEECIGKGGGSEKEHGGGERDHGGEKRVTGEEEEEVRLLQEMFPGACSLEVRHCLAIAGGDLPRAAQLVLHRQEAGQSLTVASSAVQVGAGRQKVCMDDRQLKERIIARYSYIDHEEDKREHRPVAPKSEPKKLIRYRDNKIVSIKGERFTEVRKEEEGGGAEAGGDPMKKTYVNLKPARQYRFH